MSNYSKVCCVPTLGKNGGLWGIHGRAGCQGKGSTCKLVPKGSSEAFCEGIKGQVQTKRIKSRYRVLKVRKNRAKFRKLTAQLEGEGRVREKRGTRRLEVQD